MITTTFALVLFVWFIVLGLILADVYYKRKAIMKVYKVVRVEHDMYSNKHYYSLCKEKYPEYTIEYKFGKEIKSKNYIFVFNYEYDALVRQKEMNNRKGYEDIEVAILECTTHDMMMLRDDIPLPKHKEYYG